MKNGVSLSFLRLSPFKEVFPTVIDIRLKDLSLTMQIMNR